MTRVILVGVDGRPGSDAAVEWVAEQARETGARVIAVHVVPTAWEWEMSAVQVNTEPLIRSLRHDLSSRWTEPLRRAGVPYTTKFLEGDPGKELLRVAERESADLIVIGAKPHGRVHELVFGGTTHQLVTKAPCPVVFVPAHALEKTRQVPAAAHGR
jgi:nucleotide-binding universal stress UspA family protein